MRVLYASLFVVVFDQITKFLVKGISIPSLGIDIKGMILGESIPIIKDVFSITFIENPNMAFGIELGGKVFLSIFAIIASIALIYYLYRIRNENFWNRFSIALILGGAAGNLIDRIFYGLLYDTASLFQGNVVDFFDFNLFTINWGNFHFKFWPIFNIADTSVSIGVIALLLLYRPHHKRIVEPVEEISSGESVFKETADTTATPTQNVQ